MRSSEYAPLFRSTVGFDRLFDMLENSVRTDWPPYNIEKISENDYRITMAVAGFGPDEVELTQHGPELTVIGQKKPEENDRQIPSPRPGDRQLQAGVQAGRLCEGRECLAGKRSAFDRSGARDPRGDETPSHRHHVVARCGLGRRHRQDGTDQPGHQAAAQSGLIDHPQDCGPPPGHAGRHRLRRMEMTDLHSLIG